MTRRAERIRQARIAQQGRESGVFLQLTSRTGGAATSAAVLGGQDRTVAIGDNLRPFATLEGYRIGQEIGRFSACWTFFYVISMK